MPDSLIVNSIIIQQFLTEKDSVSSIHKKLLDLGFDEDTILKYVSEFNRIKNARRQTMGAIFMVAGALLGFISCILALVNPIPELHSWFLFGLTSVAISLAFYGLYCMFE